MKTLIIYVSKRGTTKESAIKVGNDIKADVIGIKEVNQNILKDYEQVIIGSYLYAGMIPAKMKKFIINNAGILKSKKISFFVMGIGQDKEMIETFKKQLPKELIDNIFAIEHFGGEMRLDKANFFEKIILKKVVEEQKLNPKVNEEAINNFINRIKDGMK